MDILDAQDAYKNALKAGQREYRDLTARGLDPFPAVLDRRIENPDALSIQPVGVVEIPVERIVGTRTEGRTSAFSASFLPLLDQNSEFAQKWIRLCAEHLSDTGIRDPIDCFEYLGDFYVQEGNKRLSVLKYFGAPTIAANVRRILPAPGDDPRLQAYAEFLEFYKCTGLYAVQFRRPGDYAKLLALLGREPDQVWTESERRSFATGYHYFREAFNSLEGEKADLQPEETLLLWLKVYPFSDLEKLSAAELKKTLSGLWDDARAGEPVSVTEMPEAARRGIISSLISPEKSHLNVAFVHQRDGEQSLWTRAHVQGSRWLQEKLEDRVTVRSYFYADSPEDAEARIEEAVADGAEAVFTTTPSLLRPTLKCAVAHPRVRFFNCCADVPFSSVRGYYFRTFEAKFITGAIAGAVSKGDSIGYIASYPILGVPASINAFALGAQMTNPDARIVLRWSCQSGDHTGEFLSRGIHVISNRDVPTPENKYMEFGDYGTFTVTPEGIFMPLGSPTWLWGVFYERAVRGILSGSLDSAKAPGEAISYWLGMDSGVVDVTLSESLPESVRFLAGRLRDDLRAGTLDIFRRRILAQDGREINDGSRSLTPCQLLHMDWLCENVEGNIPAFDEILPISQALVRELGIYKDDIPPEKEPVK